MGAAGRGHLTREPARKGMRSVAIAMFFSGPFALFVVWKLIAEPAAP